MSTVSHFDEGLPENADDSMLNESATIDGRIMPSFDSLAFDDNGRVLAQLPFRGLASGCRTPAIDAGLFFLTVTNWRILYHV